MIAARRITGVILLGGCGWLLMEPRAGVPLKEWEQIQAFDTAHDCESSKEASVRAELNDPVPFTNTTATVDRMMSRRCVPSEEVYSSPAAPPAAKAWWWPW